ncbi:MAG: IS481 family transposase [Methylophaga sp.]|uniref:IS481 family transposase n=1 Tax=Methylophaga sp. UBA678 TaxID=1946901 RepID=UPI000C3D4EF5|nr:IS481 family transposase [Methylophaga sp. UBA678]MAX53581.1 IS481 family transposase [Methylophaga sp.]|tara:strand:+ start:10768 stop:11949 length:1182 start_codon:yes stop_codon:yes gene_type:complete
MPWRDVKPMEERILFIADYLRGAGGSFSELCRRYQISRKTGYKWLQRYQAKGLDGMAEQSRRPFSHPQTIPYAIKQAILDIRTASRVQPGPKKIQARLRIRFPNLEPPSLTTIYNVLNREGLVDKRRKRRRVASYQEPFKSVNASNQVWSVDFKGQFKLGNGQWCYPLTVMDHHSRFLLACIGLKTTATDSTRRCFEQVFREFGLPLRIRSDNGVPFASKAAGGLSALSIWWIKLGIHPERIQPGRPQQNGQHERMHRTLKQDIKHQPVSHSMAAQQQQFEAFCQAYNQQRPHEALQQQTPGSQYTVSERAYPDKLEPIHYPDYFDVLKVTRTGVVYWGGGQVYVSHLLSGEYIGMEQVADGVWDIYFGPVRLGGFDQRKVRGGDTSYWTIRV